MAEHVPAWKRLGLQLKNDTSRHVQQDDGPPSPKKQKISKEHQQPQALTLQQITKGGPKEFQGVTESANDHEGEGSAARKTPNDDSNASHDQPPAHLRLRGGPKKIKGVTKSAEAAEASRKEAAELKAQQDADAVAAEVQSNGQAAPKKRKRKSVSFDVDVKQHDGDIYDADPAQLTLASRDVKAADDDDDISDDAIMDDNAVIGTSWAMKETNKKPLTVKPSSPANDSASSDLTLQPKKKRTKSSGWPTPEAPVLIYLKQYSSDRDNWKFNKNHQTKLLDNAFNFYRIPPSYDDAFAEYVSGLKGLTARERLGEDALKIVDDTADLEEGTEAAIDVDEADKADEGKHHPWQKAKRSRAQLILSALAVSEAEVMMEAKRKADAKTASSLDPATSNVIAPTSTSASTAAPDSTNITAPPKRAKGRSRGRARKARTEVESDDSESSILSSDSSDDDDD